MTDTAIAEALGIAVSTAHEFIEKAKRRMNVRSRTQLAGIAGALGIADI
jgi:DNA-binding NarL/FixJ family response regulator